MDNFQHISNKLEAFIRKYYVNELIRGSILFFAVGLLYFLLLVFLEYALWLGQTGRTILFWSFIVVELALFFRFILIPLARLFKLSKGIDFEQASSIIGKHFPEVNDKLLNVLQLKQSGKESELLLAGIDQKAAELRPIPFNFAIDFRKNLKYTKYAAIPVLVILLIYISGKSNLFSDSYERIVNYQQVYEPPAPFQFFIGNENLTARQNESFTLKVMTRGNVVPQDVSINFNGETYFMEPISPGIFEYRFEKITNPVEFYLTANTLTSRTYKILALPVPTLLDFEMQLDYPTYTGKQDESIKGSGNATVPEGTKITWKLKTQATDRVNFFIADTVLTFEKTADGFSHQQRIYRNTDYEISTSNTHIKDYEKLAYSLNSIPDEYPEMELQMKIDSVDKRSMYFHGQVSDDYGLSKLELVYHPINEPESIENEPISISRGNFDEFLFSFPGNLPLKKGVEYEFYFLVYDNDGINGSKKTKSRVFSFRKLSESEKERELLQNQKNAIEGMDNSLKKMEGFEKELDELNRMEKQQKQWSYTDRKKLENFLERQERQREMMKDFNKDLQKNLEEFQPENKDNEDKKALQERLKRNEKKLEENEELLKKLEEYSKKINEEKLGDELEQLAKENINQQKNLEQLLELVKRFYVEQKANKIAEDLNRLAEKQEELSEKDDENTSEAQAELNKEFNDIKKEIDSLQKENEALQNPMELGADKEKEKKISEDQQQAEENLKKSEQTENQSQKEESKSDAKQKQKNAAQKMKQMAQQMQMQMMMSSMQKNKEDAEMLRQILDNLVTFSFQQENLMEDFNEIRQQNPIYVEKLKRQNVLRENFKHIDDSLFALALRNPMISPKITEKLTDIQFSLDKSVEQLTENQTYKAISNQQYTITGANDLALMLSQTLNQMQMQMMGMGQPKSGEGQGFQLPDIIKSQEEIAKSMQEGMKKQGQQSGQQEGEKPSESQSGQQGKQGQQGQQGDGNDSQDQRDGNSSKPGQEGMNGELYEIYKQQQLLRNQLEDKIKELGLGREGKKILEDMEDIENDLLMKGFNQETLEKIIAMQYRLLKLEDASYKQEKENRRESETNLEDFDNPVNTSLEKAKEYFNTTEILNRQNLPLRQNYKELVKEYFKNND